MRELRISDKNEITELAVQTLSRTCPYIVDFYGCLVREVTGCDGWFCCYCTKLLGRAVDVYGANGHINGAHIQEGV